MNERGYVHDFSAVVCWQILFRQTSVSECIYSTARGWVLHWKITHHRCMMMQETELSIVISHYQGLFKAVFFCCKLHSIICYTVSYHEYFLDHFTASTYSANTANTVNNEESQMSCVDDFSSSGMSLFVYLIFCELMSVNKTREVIIWWTWVYILSLPLLSQ